MMVRFPTHTCVIRPQWVNNKSAMVQVMTCRLFGAKPLPEPMLTQFTDAYMRHLGGRVNASDDCFSFLTLQWRHNELAGVWSNQPYDCLLNRLFGRRSKKTPKLYVTGLCAGNSPGTGEFPAQMASNAENVSILWRHHDLVRTGRFISPCSTPSQPRSKVEEVLLQLVVLWKL